MTASQIKKATPCAIQGRRRLRGVDLARLLRFSSMEKRESRSWPWLELSSDDRRSLSDSLEYAASGYMMVGLCLNVGMK